MGRFWNSVSYGEFFGQSPDKDSDICGLREINDPPNKREEGLKLQQGHLEGSTIIYVPTRKETLSISKFLCKCGVKAAAYNAKLPRSHLRQVHNEFHENALQVTKNLKDIQGPALAIVLERLKHSGAFQETFEVAETISMGPSLKSGSKVGKSSSNGHGDRRAGNRAVSSRVTSTKGSRPESIMSVHELDEHPPQHISYQVHEAKLYKTTWQYKHFLED